MKMIIKNITLLSLVITLQYHNVAYAIDEILRDPMTIGKYKEKNIFGIDEEVKLQAIVISEDGDKKCIIKNILLSVGDVISNYKVQDIQEDRVILADENDDLKVITLY